MTELSGAFILPALLGGFSIAFISPLIQRVLRERTSYLLCLLPLGFFTYFATLAISLPIDHFWLHSREWVKILDINLSFRLDGLSLLFALLISSFGFLITLYSGKYLEGSKDLGKFYCLLLTFMTSMLGLVLADNLMVLFLFWELTTFSSFLLIGLDHHKEEARASAWQAIIITTAGAIAMLAGFILLGEVVGSYSITTILVSGDLIRSSELYLPILILVLLGAFTKSAQFPFHFWLPGAMTAPTPISAYLHSATMVKAGIYLMARLSFALGHTPEWFAILIIIGSLTMITGAVLALKQDDMKLVLAYLTLMALGTLTLLLGIGSRYAIKSVIVFLLVHSLYKGALFLVVGSIDHSAGTRKVSELGGLLKKMPFTSTTAVLALLSMAGLPPALGFIGKELIYKAALAHEGVVFIIITIALVAAMASGTGVATYLFIKVFLGSSSNHEAFHECKFLWIPPMILAIIGTVTGLSTMWMEISFMKSAVSVILGEWVKEEIFPSMKLDMALGLSIISTLLGILIFWTLPSLKEKIVSLSGTLSLFSSAVIYQKSQKALLALGAWVDRVSQRGFYHKYFTVILSTSVLALIFGLVSSDSRLLLPGFTSLDFFEWILVLVIIVSAIASIITTSFIASAILLGVLGFAISLIFVIYGAPDLALTQLLIETLTIILFAIIAIRFPRHVKLKFTSYPRIKDLYISIVFGSVMTIILWYFTSLPQDTTLAKFFAESSYPLAKGRNVVNVILVDFRALDTLGEITVLTVAGLGFFSLLKFGRSKKESP